MCSFIERALSRKKARFLAESEREMVAWQMEEVQVCLACRICRFGERARRRRNALDYMISTVECHRQRIGADRSG